jgi:hypothetical protein
MSNNVCDLYISINLLILKTMILQYDIEDLTSLLMLLADRIVF